MYILYNIHICIIFRTHGFIPSATQPITPSDGNCMFHALLDQVIKSYFLYYVEDLKTN